jgi:hypothetical protein
MESKSDGSGTDVSASPAGDSPLLSPVAIAGLPWSGSVHPVRSVTTSTR